MDARLERIRDLINDKERIDNELEALLAGGEPKARRGRPRKEENGADPPPAQETT